MGMSIAQDLGLYGLLLMLVVGLSTRWPQEGVGAARLALVTSARARVLLVRRGMRPGGLAPRESLTRFTWSLGAASP